MESHLGCNLLYGLGFKGRTILTRVFHDLSNSTVLASEVLIDGFFDGSYK
jgi:hypothetical protein